LDNILEELCAWGVLSESVWNPIQSRAEVAFLDLQKVQDLLEVGKRRAVVA